MIGPKEILILLAIALLLFGAKRLPDLARSIGRSARILKAETKGLNDEDTASAAGGQGEERPADRESDEHHRSQQGHRQLPVGSQRGERLGERDERSQSNR